MTGDMERWNAALEHIWEAMVVLAEEGNDLVVNAQRDPDAAIARHLSEIASDLAALACAAEVLAKRKAPR